MAFLGELGTHSLDIDEVANQIIIGVENTSNIAPVAARVLDAGVPADAFQVEVQPVGAPRQSLTSVARPTSAGYEIDNVSTLKGACSLGFNTFESGGSGSRAWMTASHCTDTDFSTDGAIFKQPATGGRIGEETNDPALVGGYLSFNGNAYVCNNSPPSCRFSDAALSTYYDSITSDLGSIARPGSWGYLQPGSSQIVGEWEIFNKLPMTNMPVGTWLNKVGRTTGWTRGQVTNTCIDHSTSTGDLLCLWDTDIHSQGGDSGAPIFLDVNFHPPSTVTFVHLAGILYGGPFGEWDITWFSTIEGIERDFNMSFTVCDPQHSC